MNDPVFCKDCKWFPLGEPLKPEDMIICHHPKSYSCTPGPVSLVTGRPGPDLIKFFHCATLRKSFYPEKCGPDGRWFERSDATREGVK
jgi:hypothetical protein